MKNILSLHSILILVIIYSGFSFFSLSFNPHYWSELSRLMFIFLCFAYISAIITFNYLEHD